MKHLLFICLLLKLVPHLHAQSISAPSTSDQAIAIPSSSFDIRFSVFWFPDDFPRNSAPGRIDLLSGTTLVGRVVASNYRGSGAAVSITGGGTVDEILTHVTFYTPSGAPADGMLQGTWHLTGLTPGAYTVRTWRYQTYDRLLLASAVTTETSYDGGSTPGPSNRNPTVTWTAAPSGAANSDGYYIAAHGHDDDGNLAQVNVWKDGIPFASAGGGNRFDADSGNASSDGGPRTVTFTAQAVDADGASSAFITHTVSIDAPAPVQFSLTTVAGSGGGVSPGGSFSGGTTVQVVATPDPIHEFSGWSGDIGGTANPAGVPMDRNKSVQANFSWKRFTLTTSATAGGSVTPGGSYPYGSIVTLTATPDSTARFTGWSGDAGGASETTPVTVNGPLNVQASFVPKTAQSIIFANPGNRSTGAPPFSLDAVSSAGLPVSFTVLSGPALLSGGELSITGPGAITVQAAQAGDAYYLAAPAVTQTFNSAAPVVIKFRGAARTVLQTRNPEAPTNLILENP